MRQRLQATVAGTTQAKDIACLSEARGPAAAFSSGAARGWRDSERLGRKFDKAGEFSEQPGTAHEIKDPRTGTGLCGGHLEAEFVGPGDKRAEQQLIVDQDHIASIVTA